MRERRAYICEAKGCADKNNGVPLRVFLTPEDPDDFIPRCPTHGKMTRQSNRPYRKRKR